MTLLEVEELAVHFPVKRGLWQRTVGMVRAVDGVSFSLDAATTLGVVGESGSGKSTAARAILRLLPITSGRVRIDGVDIASLAGRELRRARANMQMVFQDPYASLDPRMSVLDIVAEPLVTHDRVRGKAALRAKVAELIEHVGLSPDQLRRYPHELSGGQRQRVGIARALALEPKLVVADEPVSALDMSIRAQIVNLLIDLQRELGIAFLFIAHDLAIVRHVAERVLVMYLGRVVEEAPAAELFRRPAHPYTQALLSAVLSPDPLVEKKRRRLLLAGEPPSPLDRLGGHASGAAPRGCAFQPRCPHAFDRCHSERPELADRGDGHRVACHLPADHWDESPPSPPAPQRGDGGEEPP